MNYSTYIIPRRKVIKKCTTYKTNESTSQHKGKYIFFWLTSMYKFISKTKNIYEFGIVLIPCLRQHSMKPREDKNGS